jgi:hypothetical protein
MKKPAKELLTREENHELAIAKLRDSIGDNLVETFNCLDDWSQADEEPLDLDELGSGPIKSLAERRIG